MRYFLAYKGMRETRVFVNACPSVLYLQNRVVSRAMFHDRLDSAERCNDTAIRARTLYHLSYRGQRGQRGDSFWKGFAAKHPAAPLPKSPPPSGRAGRAFWSPP